MIPDIREIKTVAEGWQLARALIPIESEATFYLGVAFAFRLMANGANPADLLAETGAKAAVEIAALK